MNLRYLGPDMSVVVMRSRALTSHLRKQAQREPGTLPRLHTLLASKLGLGTRTFSGLFSGRLKYPFLVIMRSRGWTDLLNSSFSCKSSVPPCDFQPRALLFLGHCDHILLDHKAEGQDLNLMYIYILAITARAQPGSDLE